MNTELKTCRLTMPASAKSSGFNFRNPQTSAPRLAPKCNGDHAMATTAEQIRLYSGPAVLSYGFRPFSLGGAVWAIVAVTLWLPMLAGEISVPTAFAPLEWHVHEIDLWVCTRRHRRVLTDGSTQLDRSFAGHRHAASGTVSDLARRTSRHPCICTTGAPLAAAIDVLFLVGLGAVISRAKSSPAATHAI